MDFGEVALLAVSSCSLLVHLLLGVWRSHGVTRPWRWLKDWCSVFLWGIQWEEGVDKVVAEKLTNTQRRLGTLMSSATLNLYSVSVLVSLFLGRPTFALSQEDENLLMLPRLLLAVCHFHPLSVLAWNLIISLSIIFSTASGEMDIMQGDWASLVRNELMSTFAFFLVSFCCWIWMLECSRRDVATSMLQVERSASRSLLGMACDVVVQLDEQLQLTDDSPQLAAMFFRRPDLAAKGADFMEFFSKPEDADQFRDMLTNSTMKLGTPGTGCYRATFNDGIRNSIRCDLFFVKLRLLEAGSQARFHIGIREGSEFKGTAQQPNRDNNLKRSRTGPASMLRKGTAAFNEAHTLRSDSDGVVLAAGDANRRTDENLRFQGLRKTSGDAMAFDLMCLVADWNVHVPPMSCCNSHAGLLHAKKVLKRLEKGPCAKLTDQEPTAMQCRRCGRLDFDMEPGDMDFECPACTGCEFWPCGEYERRMMLSSGNFSSQAESGEYVGSLQSMDSTGRPLPPLPEHPPRPGTVVLVEPMTTSISGISGGASARSTLSSLESPQASPSVNAAEQQQMAERPKVAKMKTADRKSVV